MTSSVSGLYRTCVAPFSREPDCVQGWFGITNGVLGSVIFIVESLSCDVDEHLCCRIGRAAAYLFRSFNARFGSSQLKLIACPLCQLARAKRAIAGPAHCGERASP